jgi:ferredoxin-NADP reductase
MAVVHQAEVTRIDRFSSGGSLLRLRMREPLELAHRGGQYIIVSTGLSYPNGKAGKRAYSLFGSNAEQTEFYLAAEPVDDGLVSLYLQEREVGEILSFSGPWGKLGTPEDSWKADRPLLFVAAETGITAILGLMSSRPLPKGSRLVWFRRPEARFLPDEVVHELLPSELEDRSFVALRPGHASVGQEALVDSYQGLYLAGEATLIEALEQDFVNRGGRADFLQKELFFRRI